MQGTSGAEARPDFAALRGAEASALPRQYAQFERLDNQPVTWDKLSHAHGHGTECPIPASTAPEILNHNNHLQAVDWQGPCNRPGVLQKHYFAPETTKG
jgi:hypothetical protein